MLMSSPHVSNSNMSISSPHVGNSKISMSSPHVSNSYISMSSPHVSNSHMSMSSQHVSNSHMSMSSPHVSNSHMSMSSPHVSNSHMLMSSPYVSTSHMSMSSPHVSNSHMLMPPPHVSNFLMLMPLYTFVTPTHFQVLRCSTPTSLHISSVVAHELTCVRTVPSTCQKKVTEKPSVNHIGSSDEPLIALTFTCVEDKTFTVVSQNSSKLCVHKGTFVPQRKLLRLDVW